MTIPKSEKVEIEIQKQVMDHASCKYMVLVKSENNNETKLKILTTCLLYTSPSPRDS